MAAKHAPTPKATHDDREWRHRAARWRRRPYPISTAGRWRASKPRHSGAADRQHRGRCARTAQRQLAQRAGVLAAIIEDTEVTRLAGGQIEFAAYATLVNAERRLLRDLGLERKPRDVTQDADHDPFRRFAAHLEHGDHAA
jgi:hypothetical protein